MKCKYCKKKLNLINFKCKCNNYYCIKHQLPHNHNCQFDYKKESKNLILKNNPKINSSMENKILK